MTVSIALKKTISRPRKPPSPMWIPAVGLSLVSTAICSMNALLSVAGTLATHSLINGSTVVYAGYGVVKAFRNLAATGESILNHYIPDTTIPLTPNQSMARSFNAMAHSSVASAINYMSAHHIAPDFFSNAPRGAALDVFMGILWAGCSKILGSDDDNKPPKNGPKP